MKLKNKVSSLLLVGGVTLALWVGVPQLAPAQDFPTKPITIYCGFAAGATTDLAARALASGAEKLLGVPVVVETKAVGSSMVAAGLIATKNPDG